MPLTTFLHDCELNKPTSNKVLNELLSEVRQKTGRDWQIIERQCYNKKRWWKSHRNNKVTEYELYVYVGGFGPWQQINFYNESQDSSINLKNPSSVVAAYLFGILAGVHSMELKNEKH
jgi:hypothetical protein